MSKIVDEFMRMMGIYYLNSTLEPVVRAICEHPGNVEVTACVRYVHRLTNHWKIDPSRVGPDGHLQSNIAELEKSATTVLHAITSSIRDCP